MVFLDVPAYLLPLSIDETIRPRVIPKKIPNNMWIGDRIEMSISPVTTYTIYIEIGATIRDQSTPRDEAIKNAELISLGLRGRGVKGSTIL